MLTFAWQLWRPRLLFLQVMWAIGIAMMSLGALCRLPPRAVLAVGALIVAGHNALDSLSPALFGPLAPLWRALHAGGELARTPVRIVVGYPVLPWVGIMALGFGLGPFFARDTGPRRLFLTRLGLGLTVVRLVAELHGGSAHARNRDDGRGVEFTLDLRGMPRRRL